MPEEKDRYGDKMRDVERAREDKFFADRDRELVEKMQQKLATQGADTRGHCPSCGERLTKVSHLGVEVDECPTCHGMWLDKNELQQLAHRESNGWLARFLGRPR